MSRLLHRIEDFALDTAWLIAYPVTWLMFFAVGRLLVPDRIADLRIGWTHWSAMWRLYFEHRAVSPGDVMEARRIRREFELHGRALDALKRDF